MTMIAMIAILKIPVTMATTMMLAIIIMPDLMVCISIIIVCTCLHIHLPEKKMIFRTRHKMIMLVTTVDSMVLYRLRLEDCTLTIRHFYKAGFQGS